MFQPIKSKAVERIIDEIIDQYIERHKKTVRSIEQ